MGRTVNSMEKLCNEMETVDGLASRMLAVFAKRQSQQE